MGVGRVYYIKRECGRCLVRGRVPSDISIWASSGKSNLFSTRGESLGGRPIRRLLLWFLFVFAGFGGSQWLGGSEGILIDLESGRGNFLVLPMSLYFLVCHCRRGEGYGSLYEPTNYFLECESGMVDSGG